MQPPHAGGSLLAKPARQGRTCGLTSRLTQLRKARGLSQQRFADLAGLHVNQIKRYEAGTAQPTLDALVNLAQALHVSLDNMVFAEGERGPPDELRLQFEAISQFTPEEKEVARTVLESLILRHTANRFSRNAQQSSS